MKTEKSRNIIAIIAIALTTILFTSLFTIILTMTYSMEQSIFRSVGGYNHGTFKYLTFPQVEELKEDSLISEYGIRRIVGFPNDPPFHKSHFEVSYCDLNSAKWSYIEPIRGDYPKENTQEAMADERFFSLLGIDPIIGTEFTFTFDVDGVKTTQTFILSGLLEFNEDSGVGNVVIPNSRVDEIFQELDTKGNDGMTTKYSLEVMLKNKTNIDWGMNKILERHGYQSSELSQKDTYIRYGVNWGYMSAQFSNSADPYTIVCVMALLILIICTGYLVIYNIFQISISKEIQFYGMLKTIGTTGRQIKKMVLLQALLLSFFGIPISLLLGYVIGCKLAPVILSMMNGADVKDQSTSPWIFVLSAIFALTTVVISCIKPAKKAAKVSPMEALRYTEGSNIKKCFRKSIKGASLYRMAWANLGRNKAKTGITIISMSLAVVLLNLTYTFSNSFDVDKYMRDFPVDFLMADATYFQSNYSEGATILESDIEQMDAVGNIIDSGRTYGMTGTAYEYITPEHMMELYGDFSTKEEINSFIDFLNKDKDGKVEISAQLYGMEEFCLKQMDVMEGDITKVIGDGNYIAAVYHQDDYGEPILKSNWAKIGDKVKIRYVIKMEYYNPETGEIYGENPPEDDIYKSRAIEYKDVEYEVAVLVSVPSTLSYRYYLLDEFIMNANKFCQDSGTDSIMYYACDVEESSLETMENFLIDYTQNVMQYYDYESKEVYVKEMNSFKSMFVILGSVLSGIIGLVGVLNFFNAILSGILIRRREFAVMQAVGMTGKQLKKMLIVEGLIYAVSSILVAFTLNIIMSPIISSIFNIIFWFCTYRFTVVPIVILAPLFVFLGIVVPLILYRWIAKKPIVERLSEVN